MCDFVRQSCVALLLTTCLLLTWTAVFGKEVAPVNERLAVKQLRQFPGLAGAAGQSFSACSVSADGLSFAVADRDGVGVYDVGTGQRTLAFDQAPKWTDAIAFSPDGKYVLSGAHGNVAILWDATTGKRVREFADNTGDITSVGFSADGSRVIVCAENIRVLDRETGAEHEHHAINKQEKGIAVMSVESHPLVAIVTRRPEEGDFSSTVRLYDLDRREDVHKFSGPACNHITSLAFVPETDMVLIVYDRYILTFLGLGPLSSVEFLQVRRVTDGDVLFNSRFGRDYGNLSVACFPDGRRFLLAGRGVWLWQLRGAK